jgi:hypothetical protein
MSPVSATINGERRAQERAREEASATNGPA